MSEVQDTIELAKRRGFFWQSSSIYGGTSGFYTYGPLGTLMKRNIVQAWVNSYITIGALIVDSPVITQEEVFRASGHLERFNDLIYECPSCGSKQKLETLLKNSGSGIPKDAVQGNALIQEKSLKCPVCGSDKIRALEFNTMFALSNSKTGEGRLFLRPETAQGIFVDFPLLLKQNRDKLPLVVIQVGKGFRNEVAPRNAIIRLREFSMGEVEVFFDPNTTPFVPEKDQEEIVFVPKRSPEYRGTASGALDSGVINNPGMAYFIQKTHMLLAGMGVDKDRLRFRQHRDDELSHYSSECWDAEALLDDEWTEIVGIADRGTYDLTRHQSFSGKSMQVKVDGKEFVPRVIEPAHGIDRILMSILVHSRNISEDGYTKLSLRKEISPYKLAVFPLFKKDGLSEVAREIFSRYSKADPFCVYDEAGSIGKRYARQDEAGTPYCVTVDYQTKEDHTVTVRERDTGKQIRLAIDDLVAHPITTNPAVTSAFALP
ncbi:MAG: glycine--tRNA ligase [Candidatus Thermoplasmatota archaeon]|nr:glycine--tRNA ligase [Candidatus Thermoplasmatota archaeon]